MNSYTNTSIFFRILVQRSIIFLCTFLLFLCLCIVGIIYTCFHAFYVHLNVEFFLHAFIHFTIAVQFYVDVNVELYVHTFLHLYGGEKQVC